MSDTSKKWKARLLSSSLPLEYEVAKIFTKYKISTSYDFTYNRKENGVNKEFSVDIHGMALTPFNNPNKVTSSLMILAECKFRDEGKVWAFLPETHTDDYSSLVIGYTLNSIDSFSTKRINTQPIQDLEASFNFTLKGTEINLSTGEVFDKDIRHGISQLKYALPYVLKSSIQQHGLSHIEDAVPFFILPLLITNADLYLFNNDLSINSIKETDSIDAIATRVPWLIFGNETGPDFKDHHKSVFKKIGKYRFHENIELFEHKQRSYRDRKFNIYSSPIRELEDLQESSTYILRKYYSQYFICSMNNLDEFINIIQSTVNASLKRKP